MVYLPAALIESAQAGAGVWNAGIAGALVQGQGAGAIRPDAFSVLKAVSQASAGQLGIQRAALLVGGHCADIVPALHPPAEVPGVAQLQAGLGIAVLAQALHDLNGRERFLCDRQASHAESNGGRSPNEPTFYLHSLNISALDGPGCEPFHQLAL